MTLHLKEGSTSMAVPTSAFARKREATTSAILDATSQIIAERGVDGFTMTEVAQRAKINRSLIYHYFKDRDRLILESIRYLIHRYDHMQPEIGPDAIEGSIRMNLEHPEIGRFFFQLLLNGRPIPSLGQRIISAIEDLERFRQEHAPQVQYDAAMAVLTGALLEMAWPFSRDQVARLLGVGTEEADARFIAHLRRHAGLAMQSMTNSAT